MRLKLMKLNVFYGDTKHGNVVDCDSFEDAEKLIRESAGKGFANIVLNDKKYPQMQINVSKNLTAAQTTTRTTMLKPICIITTTSISRRGFRAANTISPLNFWRGVSKNCEPPKRITL